VPCLPFKKNGEIDVHVWRKDRQHIIRCGLFFLLDNILFTRLIFLKRNGRLPLRIGFLKQ